MGWRYAGWALLAGLFLASYLAPQYRSRGLMNDEALVLLQSEDLPGDRFVFLAPGYAQHPEVGQEETLALYLIRLIRGISGGDLLAVRLFYAVSLLVACVLFYLTLSELYSPGYGALGAVFLAGSAYAGFYNRLLHRNAMSLFWSCLIIRIIWQYASLAESRKSPAPALALLAVALPLAVWSYTSFQFVSAAVVVALALWAAFRAPRARGALAVAAAGAIAAAAAGVLIYTGGQSVAEVVTRGGYVLVGGRSAAHYLRNLGLSFLMPLHVTAYEDFLADITHMSFCRHTLSYLLAPFFVIGVFDAARGGGTQAGFRRIILSVWCLGTALIAAGGPALKHHYALFPFVLLLSVCGLRQARCWTREALGPGAAVLIACALSAAYAASEAAHLFYTVPGSAKLQFDRQMPRALAQTAIAQARTSSRVHLVQSICRDALHCYTRRNPAIRYWEQYGGAAFESELARDVAAGRMVSIVLSEHVLLVPLTRRPELADCFTRSWIYADGWPVTVYRSLELASAARGRLNAILAGGAEAAEVQPPAARAEHEGLFSRLFRSRRAAPASVPAAPPCAEGRRGGLLGGRAGNGPGEYCEPRGIALDANGNCYVADFRNYRIQKFGPGGAFSRAWGAHGKDPGRFEDPCGVACDLKGRVYVADTFNNRVQVFSSEGRLICAFEGGFFAPRGIAVDNGGKVWVADTGNSFVKVFSPEGKPLQQIGGRGRGRGEFDGPNDVAVDSSGRALVADAGNRRVQIFDSRGRYSREFAVDGWQQGVFNEPYLDADAGGDIYLTDPRGNRALRYSAAGKLLGVLDPREADGRPQLLFPMGIAVEKGGGGVYLVDSQNHRVRRFSKRDFK